MSDERLILTGTHVELLPLTPAHAEELLAAARAHRTADRQAEAAPRPARRPRRGAAPVPA